MIDYNKNKPKILTLLLAVLAIICLVITIGINNPSFRLFLGKIRYLDQRCQDTDGVFAFLNVDNADASLIYTNQAIGLIDAGLSDTVEVITRNLSELKTESLDFVVISHPHSDHAGGYLELIKQVQVKRLFIGKYNENDFENISLYNEIIKVSNEKGIEVIYATHGMDVRIGDISLFFFDASHSSADENHNSLLVKVKIGSKSCLFAGDAGEEAERYLLSLGSDVAADILKVGHHGSNTASSEEFIKAVSPMYSVISVGYNQYGHPHIETIHRLAAFGCATYRTDICDRIMFKIDDTGINVMVE